MQVFSILLIFLYKLRRTALPAYYVYKISEGILKIIEFFVNSKISKEALCDNFY